MFKLFKKKLPADVKKEEQLRLIQMAEDNGIYVPPASRKICERKPGQPIGMNYWYTSLERRAEIAERELKRKGLL